MRSTCRNKSTWTPMRRRGLSQILRRPPVTRPRTMKCLGRGNPGAHRTVSMPPMPPGGPPSRRAVPPMPERPRVLCMYLGVYEIPIQFGLSPLPGGRPPRRGPSGSRSAEDSAYSEEGADGVQRRKRMKKRQRKKRSSRWRFTMRYWTR